METLTNDQIRKAVLEALYEDENKNPEKMGLGSISLKKELKLSDAQMNACISYLTQKGLITVHENWLPTKETDEHTVGVERIGYLLKITALGVDVVERKDQFAKEFPFMHVTIENISGTLQNIGGNVYGNITSVQGDGNIVSISQQIAGAFQQAYDKVKDSDLPSQQKESINTQLKDLEQELHKEDKANVGKIQKISKWLKDNANWIVPILSDVIKKGLEKACGI